jgi:hypothetical protein
MLLIHPNGSCLRVLAAERTSCRLAAIGKLSIGELLHDSSSGCPEYELTGKAAPPPKADEGGKGGVPVVDPVVLVQVVRAGKPLPAQLQHK